MVAKDLSGFAIVDKPSGCTSHDVVSRARKLLGTRKIGHGGTLDPDATGVLVLGVGRGTRLLRYLSGSDKHYVGEVVFGTTTNTLDAAGEVTGNYDMDGLEPTAVVAAAESFVGDILQVPPMVSAIKVDGRRLHELAREGKEVERPPRPVTVHSLTVETTDNPLVFGISVHCSSGTYIRSLADDLGRALGGGAHLRGLRRTAVGKLGLVGSVALDDLSPDALLPLATGVSGLPRRDVDADTAAVVRQGAVLPAEVFAPCPDTPWAVFGDDALLAVYQPHPSKPGKTKPEMVLA